MDPSRIESRHPGLAIPRRGVMALHRILVVDDNSIFQRWSEVILTAEKDLVVTHCVSRDLENIESAETNAPDVILMDLSPPGGNGFKAIRAMKRTLPKSNILVFTDSTMPEHVFAALSAGARGYILKDAKAPELVRAVFQVAAGGIVLSPGLAGPLLCILSMRAQGGLTYRQTQVLAMLAKGASNKTISSLLSVSVHTVKFHIGRTMKKLGVSDRHEAASLSFLVSDAYK